ncbi:MAG: vWA domain-containing protein, partial [Candidatus Kapaibacterium sp.]
MMDREVHSTRQRIEQDDFFARMDDFGFFETVAEHLPDEFTAVYEIARVLENDEHPLGRILAPVLSVAATDDGTPPDPDTVPNIIPAEEYEADLIRSVQEVPGIYPHQFLLPEDVFFRKLAERSLWMPRSRAPQTYRFQSESETFKPDYRKQKVYVLFDVSRSMNMRWRIHLAKAIAVVFLQRNRKELGTVYLRNFAETVHELQEAHDLPAYNKLISSIMHVKALGKGTVLQRALLTAIEDIRRFSGLSDAEILVITDGAAHIELKKVRDALGDDIRIHTVKIGDEKIDVDAKFVEYHLRDANTEDAERLRTLLEKQRALEAQSAAATGGTLKARLAQELSGVKRQVALFTERVGAYIRDHFGKEIIELSTVYVNVPDIDPREIVRLSEERIQELERSVDALLDALHREKLT